MCQGTHTHKLLQAAYPILPPHRKGNDSPPENHRQQVSQSITTAVRRPMSLSHPHPMFHNLPSSDLSDQCTRSRQLQYSSGHIGSNGPNPLTRPLLLYPMSKRKRTSIVGEHLHCAKHLTRCSLRRLVDQPNHITTTSSHPPLSPAFLRGQAARPRLASLSTKPRLLSNHPSLPGASQPGVLLVNRKGPRKKKKTPFA